MTIEVPLPDEIIAAIDQRTGDRATFIQAAIRAYLAVERLRPDREDLDIISSHASELNEEAEDVLAFQIVP